MQFKQELEPGILVRRYKRFLADIELPDKTIRTVHCPNSGSMLGCSSPGSPVMTSRSENPARKYPHTLEMVRVGSVWVGVNTMLTNQLVREALESGMVQELGKPEVIVQEVKTSASTRLDFFLERGAARIYMEVKNCSLAEKMVAKFPDARTVRGAKHLHELVALKKQGFTAAVFFCVQRQDAECFMPAHHIDPDYAKMLGSAAEAGVMVLAYRADVGPHEIKISKRLPVKLIG